MSRYEIIYKFLNSNIINQWHWFNYHFKYYLFGLEHPFANSIVDSICEIGEKIPEADESYITKLSSYFGQEKNLEHYEQLMQILAEILIIHEATVFNWNKFKRFEYEPITELSKKNPELNIFTEDFIYGIEVKSPNLYKHQKNRSSNPFQLTSRSNFINIVEKSQTTYPKDNVIKDFLISANDKFKSFKIKYPNYISILYIVWDDFINEPISALLGEPYGLLMNESYAKDINNNILKFENVDFIFLSRHQYQFRLAAAEKKYPLEFTHALDYGVSNVFPYKVVIKNPSSKFDLTKDLIDCFQITPPHKLMGAEYSPGDIIYWI